MTRIIVEYLVSGLSPLAMKKLTTVIIEPKIKGNIFFELSYPYSRKAKASLIIFPKSALNWANDPTFSFQGIMSQRADPFKMERYLSL
jgi:hypothetical protein